MQFVTAAAVCVLAVFLCAAFYNGLTVRFYTVQSSKIKKKIRILQLSDLHCSRFGKDQSVIVSKIKSLNPDIICITGDTFDERTGPENAKALLNKLKGYKIFNVNGNHELYINYKAEARRILRRNGAVTLDGEAARTNGIWICGVSDPKKEESGEQKDGETFKERLKKARMACGENEREFKMLLSHRPEKIAEYLPHGFDLILSGHAHGGQWRLPFLINGLYAPHQGLFPKYAGGFYKYGDTAFAVSRGLSKLLLIPRIFNPPEICAIDLEPKNQTPASVTAD